MQATPGVAEPLDKQPLDEAVHVLVGAGHKVRIRDAQFEDLGQRLLDMPCVVGRQHAGPGERARPGQAARDIVGKETPVEAE